MQLAKWSMAWKREFVAPRSGADRSGARMGSLWWFDSSTGDGMGLNTLLTVGRLPVSGLELTGRTNDNQSGCAEKLSPKRARGPIMGHTVTPARDAVSSRPYGEARAPGAVSHGEVSESRLPRRSDRPRRAQIVARAQDRKEPAAKPVAEEIQQAIIALRNTDIGNSKGWATAARRLTEIGKPAVPPLIEELDRTTADRPLRSLGFTLRAIGDPRAVPALIRAIPRTLDATRKRFRTNDGRPGTSRVLEET